VIGEELGFIGVAGVALAFLFFIHRGLKIAWECHRRYDDRFGLLLAAGITLALGLQVNQMYSLKYGTVPIVRETGGLADSVQQVSPADKRGTGILFRDYDESGLAWAMNRALDLFKDKVLWKKVMRNGMAQDLTWHKQGAHYVNAFLRLSRP
jgi:starch synthase